MADIDPGPAAASDSSQDSDEGRRHRRLIGAIGFVAIVLWLVVTGPWLLGQRTLIQRDVFFADVHYQHYGMEQLAEGRIPAFNTAYGGGQPFRGNPGTLPFYPDRLLYLILPFWSAFGCHYAIHWLLAGLGTILLARRLGHSAGACLLAGLTYSSGLVLSAVSFYNSLTVLAWWPLVLAGAAGRSVTVESTSRQGAAREALQDRGGLVLALTAFGLAMLGGEPVTAALLAPALLVVLRQVGYGWAAATLRSGLVVGMGLLLAAPQIVATLRVLPFSKRGGPGFESAWAGGYGFELSRLLEFFFPFVHGIPFRFDSWGFLAAEHAFQLPYYYELFCGALTVPLVLLGLRRRPLLAAWAGLGLVLAWLGDKGPWMTDLSAGLFRHPEKLLLLTISILPLLVAAGFDRLRSESERCGRLLWVLGVFPALALAWVALRFDLFVTWHQSRLAESAPAGAGEAQALLWIAGVAGSLAAFWLAAWCVRRRRPEWLAAVQLASLVPLVALLPTDQTAAYSPPEFIEALGPRRALWSPFHANLSRLTHSAPRYMDFGFQIGSRSMAADLDPAMGIRNGLRYPIALDLEGLGSPLIDSIGRRLVTMPAEQQIRWLRAMGVEGLVIGEASRLPLPVLASWPTPDGGVVLQEVEDPMPQWLWPRSFEPAESVTDAFRRVTQSPDPVARPVVLGDVEQGALRSFELAVWQPDRIEFDVDSDGGVVVFGRTFQPLYHARAASADGSRVELRTRLVNAALLAVQVPAGRRHVVLAVSAWPENLGAGVSLLTLASCLLWLRRSPSP